MQVWRFLTIMAVTLAVPLTAHAKPKVEISITAAKEVTVKKDGKQTTRLVPTRNIDPGSVVVYTIACANTGDEPAREAVVDDPVPKGTSFIAGTAYGEGADILFSIDGGKTFKKASSLSYEVKLPDGSRQQRVASPEEYTNIRWIIATIPPGGETKVGFKAKVK